MKILNKVTSGEWRVASSEKKLITHHSSLIASQGFTMIEIALCLAIIGFALVAIIGVLPAGLNVQRNNREETIISQDATFFMNAIRTGTRGADDLTNYVYQVTKVVTAYDEQGRVLQNNPPYPITYDFTYDDYKENGTSIGAAVPANCISNGYRIVGLLSTPKYTSEGLGSRFSPAYDQLGRRTGFGSYFSNYVTAYVRAISGNATEKAPQNDSRVRDMGFTYRVVSEVTPYSSCDTNWIDYTNPNLTDPKEIAARSNAWLIAKNINTNFYDLRLRFIWPLLPNGSFGNGRQTFRTMAGGILLKTNPPFYHLASRSFAHDTRVKP